MATADDSDGRHLRATASVVALVLLLGLVPRSSWADARAVAKAHFEKGSVLYDLQRYEEAAAEYEAAYEAKQDPALLFNLGQAYRLAGKRDRALQSYQHFLRRLPQAPQRADVERRIAELVAQAEQDRLAQEKAARDKVSKDAEARAAEQKAREQAEQARLEAEGRTRATSSQAEREGRRARTMKWAGLGAGLGGALLLVTGAGVYGAGAAAFNDINSPKPGDVFDEGTERRMNTLRPTGVALFTIGLAATAAGFALFGVGLRRERAITRPSHAVELGPLGGAELVGVGR